MIKKQKQIKQIISGGQSGVDRAALDFAIQYHIPHSGFCPKNRLAEDGILSSKYNLTETKEKDPKFRTIKNIRSADGTLVIYQKIDKGTQLTIHFCINNNIPIYEFDIKREYSFLEFRQWLTQYNIQKINIAGPRESNSPGIYKLSFTLLEKLILS